MKNIGVKCVIAVFLIMVLAFIFAVSIGLVHAEEDPEINYVTFTVTASSLNCRMSPDRHSYAITELERGQEVKGTSRWSKNQRWVEIEHCEYGRLWCDYHYLTERTDPFFVETLCDDPVKIRTQAVNGKVRGYLRKGQTIEITQVVLGWGRCSSGWIDLEYCIEIER